MCKLETAEDVFNDSKLGYNDAVCGLVMAAAFGSTADKNKADRELRVKARALGEAAKFAANNPTPEPKAE